MRITYVLHAAFPTEKAYGHQVMQVCHALAALGHEVTLVAPTIRHALPDDPHAYYGVPANFSVVHLPHFDALNARWVPEFLAFTLSMRSYGKAVQRYVLSHKTDVTYVRAMALLAPLVRTGIPVIAELHAVPRFFSKKLLSQCRSVVCVTSGIKKELVRLGVDHSKLLVEPDGVDIERFKELHSSHEAKKSFHLPERPIIGYSGSLVTFDSVEKGVGEMIKALVLLKKKGTLVFGWIIGGPDTWKNLYEQKAYDLGLTKDDIRFEGRVPAAEVPQKIAAFDVCVYPAPQSNHPFFMRDTSPLKILEYLASRRPIVTADLPPIADLLDETMAEFCTAGDPSSLADAIERVLKNPEEAGRKAEKGFEKVQHHTWQKRMERILKQAV